MALISLQTVTQSTQSILTFFVKEVKNLDSGEFKSRLRNSKRARLIDVSSEEEYRELHIPGSVNYDLHSPEFLEKLEYMDRHRPYFIYCRNGQRSAAALRLMAEMGFRKIYALASGLQSWKGTLERSY